MELPPVGLPIRVTVLCDVQIFWAPLWSKCLMNGMWPPALTKPALLLQSGDPSWAFQFTVSDLKLCHGLQGSVAWHFRSKPPQTQLLLPFKSVPLIFNSPLPLETVENDTVFSFCQSLIFPVMPREIPLYHTPSTTLSTVNLQVTLVITGRKVSNTGNFKSNIKNLNFLLL